LEILTSSLYNEMNSYFSISHKIDLKIREELNEKIKNHMQVESKQKDMDINLIVSTNREILNVEVKGPSFNRKYKMINWGLWLPYEPIVGSTDQVIPYLKYYYEALVILLGRYGIDEDRLKKVWVSVENEVIGNSEYKFDEDNIDYDFSDLDLS
jgi:hypothetical protein